MALRLSYPRFTGGRRRRHVRRRRGGSAFTDFFTRTIPGAAKSVYHSVLKPVGNFALKNNLISKGLAFVPGVGPVASNVARAIGLGRRRRRSMSRGRGLTGGRSRTRSHSRRSHSMPMRRRSMSRGRGVTGGRRRSRSRGGSVYGQYRRPMAHAIMRGGRRRRRSHSRKIYRTRSLGRGRSRSRSRSHSRKRGGRITSWRKSGNMSVAQRLLSLYRNEALSGGILTGGRRRRRRVVRGRGPTGGLRRRRAPLRRRAPMRRRGGATPRHLSAWNALVRKVWRASPGLSYGQAMRKASPMYRRGAGSRSGGAMTYPGFAMF